MDKKVVKNIRSRANDRQTSVMKLEFLLGRLEVGSNTAS